MSRKLHLLIFSSFACLFTILFYRQSLGLNLVFFEAILLFFLFFRKEISLKKQSHLLAFMCLTITLLFTVIIHSVLVYWIHFITVFIFLGVLSYSEAKSTLTHLMLGLSSLTGAIQTFFSRKYMQVRPGGKKLKVFSKLKYYIIPFIIIVVFVRIYRASNPVFNDIFKGVFEFLDTYFWSIFREMNFRLFFTFLIGFAVSVIAILRYTNNSIVLRDKAGEDMLLRNRIKRRSSHLILGFKREYFQAVVLLVILNAIILILNCVDIYWVWLFFEWKGQFLKEFVHEGTNLLILSILISIAIILYYFRKNIHFYSQNKFLKYLSYIWIFQNMFLAFSVAVRNFRYIEHFALAYKRIGVFVFLICTIYGLYTVYIKVRKNKTSFYLVRRNSQMIFLTLVVFSLLNWDSIIARYNFNHSDKSFLHLDFMSELSDKSLPYLDYPLEALKDIDARQKEKFRFDVTYMTPEAYYDRIQYRKQQFRRKWESESFLSWNYAEYSAYHNMFE